MLETEEVSKLKNVFETVPEFQKHTFAVSPRELYALLFSVLGSDSLFVSLPLVDGRVSSSHDRTRLSVSSRDTESHNVNYISAVLCL